MEQDSSIREIIDAHGGSELWNSLGTLEAEVSARGLLFTLKRRPVLDHARITVFTHEPKLFFHDFPSPGLTGEFIGEEEVRIVAADTRIVARRTAPRSAFKGLRRLVSWDDLDFLYFGGYATWNYLVTPFLFLREGFRFELLEPAGGAPPGSLRLRATFPDDIPTHSRTQVFHFDEKRYLQRLDYTAEVVGSWARAAHSCEDYRDFGGLKAPTRRRVRPIFFAEKPLPWPILVALDIHDIRPVRI
ncbi:MAG: hypothetical protein U0411_11880 [Thermodesulfovibrionales bacterium]